MISLKDFLPPIFIKIFLKIGFYKVEKNKNYGWHTTYDSWELAKKNSTGYDNNEIFFKVKNAMIEVKNGNAFYERDSCLFYKKEYSNQIVLLILKIASENHGYVNVIDFGGSLGSTYYQNKDLFTSINLKWVVIEQNKFVEIGNQLFKDNVLSFNNSIKNTLKNFDPNIIILSNVLSYIEKPKELLLEIIEYNFDYILIDRTAFIDDIKDVVALQIVNPKIYNASYPSWFFNENDFISIFSKSYEILYDYPSLIEKDLLLEGKKIYWKGFWLKKIF